MPTILSGADICGIIEAEGIVVSEVTLLDDRYAIPAFDWLKDVFFTNLRFVQDTLGVYNYEAPANDCDDFGRFCSAYARLLHLRTKDRPPGTALALGDMAYWQTPETIHYINLAICKVDGVTRVFYIEPQRPGFTTLTNTQKEGVEYVRF